MSFSRRQFVSGLVTSPLLKARAIEIDHIPLGLELYSLRREMSKNVPAALEMARQFGFTDVEVPQFYGLTAPQFRKELDRVSLTCSAMVADEDLLKSGVQQAIDDAHTLGARYVIYPWIPHAGKVLTANESLAAIHSFNQRGAEFKKAGLSFCYHPHGYEFSRSPEGTLLDTIIQQTDRDVVNYQMDVFWIAWPGQSPVAYLKKYPDRFPLIHLKDLRKGAQGNQEGMAPEEESVAVGSGSIDFPAVLKAAQAAGVHRYYIEDESPEARTQIPQSVRYLKTLV